MPLTLCFCCSAQLNVKYNNLGAEGKAAIQEAVSGKAGFKLEI